MKMYDIAAEMRAVLDAIEEAEGELTPELEARLDAVEVALPSKVDNVCAVIAELNASRLVAELEADRLLKRARRRKSQAERLSQYLLRCLQRSGVRKVEAARFTASLQKTPARVVVDVPEDQIPSQWWREKVSRALDRAGLAEALKSGDDLGGIAHLEQGETVRIK